MSSAYHIFTIRGIPIRLHFSFLLVLPLLAFLFAGVFRGAAELAEVPPEAIAGPPLLWGLGVAVMLFLGVLVHELAHALVAQRKGVRVVDITLFMIGGVSRIPELPRRSRDQAWMAFAGPLVSVLLGGLFLGAWALTRGTGAFELVFALFYLGYLNVLIGVFNLLPAFPMDGGRILRALLVPRLGPVQATVTAARVGQVFAVIFGILGILAGNLFLVLIAFFVWLGASSESQQAFAQQLLSGRRVGDMVRSALTMDAAVSVADAGAELVRTQHDAAVVMEHGAPLGVLDAGNVPRIPVGERTRVQVREVVSRVEPVGPEDKVWKALQRMQEGSVRELPVVDEQGLAGVIAMDDVMRAARLAQLEPEPEASAGP